MTTQTTLSPILVDSPFRLNDSKNTGTELQKALRTEDVRVVLEATHLCIASRGVDDVNSITRTSYFSVKFEERDSTNEFLRQIKS